MAIGSSCPRREPPQNAATRAPTSTSESQEDFSHEAFLVRCFGVWSARHGHFGPGAEPRRPARRALGAFCRHVGGELDVQAARRQGRTRPGGLPDRMDHRRQVCAPAVHEHVQGPATRYLAAAGLRRPEEEVGRVPAARRRRGAHADTSPRRLVRGRWQGPHTRRGFFRQLHRQTRHAANRHNPRRPGSLRSRRVVHDGARSEGGTESPD